MGRVQPLMNGTADRFNPCNGGKMPMARQWLSSARIALAFGLENYSDSPLNREFAGTVGHLGPRDRVEPASDQGGLRTPSSRTSPLPHRSVRRHEHFSPRQRQSSQR